MVDASDREIVTQRHLKAPRELVFDAWTNPVHVAKWWGPHGFTTTIHEMDVRPGGVWRLVLHGPDGTDYQNRSVFVEIVRPERIVFDHVTGPVFRMTATFEEQNLGTLLTMRMTFKTAEERNDCVTRFGAVEGAVQTLQRLDEFLQSNSNA